MAPSVAMGTGRTGGRTRDGRVGQGRRLAGPSAPGQVRHWPWRGWASRPGRRGRPVAPSSALYPAGLARRRRG
eukprot:1042718-Pyramimonas_sp.AAC.1